MFRHCFLVSKDQILTVFSAPKVDKWHRKVRFSFQIWHNFDIWEGRFLQFWGSKKSYSGLLHSYFGVVQEGFGYFLWYWRSTFGCIFSTTLYSLLPIADFLLWGPAEALLNSGKASPGLIVIFLNWILKEKQNISPSGSHVLGYNWSFTLHFNDNRSRRGLSKRWGDLRSTLKLFKKWWESYLKDFIQKDSKHFFCAREL